MKMKTILMIISALSIQNSNAENSPKKVITPSADVIAKEIDKQVAQPNFRIHTRLDIKLANKVLSFEEISQIVEKAAHQYCDYVKTSGMKKDFADGKCFGITALAPTLTDSIFESSKSKS